MATSDFMAALLRWSAYWRGWLGKFGFLPFTSLDVPIVHLADRYEAARVLLEIAAILSSLGLDPLGGNLADRRLLAHDEFLARQSRHDRCGPRPYCERRRRSGSPSPLIWRMKAVRSLQTPGLARGRRLAIGIEVEHDGLEPSRFGVDCGVLSCFWIRSTVSEVIGLETVTNSPSVPCARADGVENNSPSKTNSAGGKGMADQAQHGCSFLRWGRRWLRTLRFIIITVREQRQNNLCPRRTDPDPS